MKQLPSRPGSSLSRGFTLIELLTVIAIIAILMGLLMAAIGGVKDAAKRMQAKNDLLQIVNVVAAYHTDYGKYPVLERGGVQLDVDFLDENRELFFPLRAIPQGDNSNHQLNPRKVIYLHGTDAKNFQTPTTATAGFDKDGDFRDPWGETAGRGGRYKIRIDASYDDNVENPYRGSAGQTPNLHTGVIAWTFGKDCKTDPADRRAGDSSDDVISWQ